MNLRPESDLSPEAKEFVASLKERLIPFLVQSISPPLFELGREQELFELAAKLFLERLDTDKVPLPEELHAKVVYDVFCTMPAFDKIEDMRNQIIRLQSEWRKVV